MRFEKTLIDKCFQALFIYQVAKETLLRLPVKNVTGSLF